MAIYIVLFLVSLAAIFLVDKKIMLFNKEIVIKRKYYFYFVIIALFLISAFRFEVGTDYSRYRDLYLQNLYPMEPLMEVVNDIARFFGNYQIVIIFSALVTNIGIFYVVKKEKINIPIATFVYIAFGFYTMFFNIFRQGNAAVLLILATYFLTKKDYKFYVLFGLLASLTHSTAFFILLVITAVYFAMTYLKKYITSRNLMIVLAVAIAMMIFLPQIDILKNITSLPFLETVSQRYLATENPFVTIREFQFTTLIRYLLQASLFLLLVKNFRYSPEKTSDFQLIAVVLSVLYILAIAFKQDSEIVNRLLVYLQLFYIFAIPYLLITYTQQEKILKLVSLAFLVMVGGLIFAITLMNNAGGVIPYQIFGL